MSLASVLESLKSPGAWFRLPELSTRPNAPLLRAALGQESQAHAADARLPGGISTSAVFSPQVTLQVWQMDLVAVGLRLPGSIFNRVLNCNMRSERGVRDGESERDETTCVSWPSASADCNIRTHGCGCQNRFGIPFWVRGTTYFSGWIGMLGGRFGFRPMATSRS